MVISTKTIQVNPTEVLLPKVDSAVEAFESLALLKLAILTALGVFILSIFSGSPHSGILVLDLLFCGYLVCLFKSKYKYLFFLHPIALFVSSQLYTIPFLGGGDGDAYGQVVASLFDSHDLSFHGERLWAENTPFNFFKLASLGVIPTYAVPEFFFGNPADDVYYLWQGTFHVFLSLIVIVLARTWRVLEEKYLFAIALFVVISPTCFEFNTVPSRHIVTFFGVFLLLIAHIATIQRFTLFRAAWYTLAVVVVVISKAPLMIPYFIFVIIDQVFIRRAKFDSKTIIVFGFLSIGILLMGSYFIKTVGYYEQISSGGLNYGAVGQIPIIGWIVKYVYALLGTFPWSSAPLYIDNNYNGNWLLFFMHTLSSLTGLYLFFIVILKRHAILASDIELKKTVVFGLIMSLSILSGATGFHGYLSIYFPMLAPLLTIKKLQINPILPIGFVVIMEAFVVFAK